ncbi:MAG TPA: hypothetical protein PKG60_10190 [Spirochaetota bacterium]|nr:hypothetical protein [Spirochaetota bacterium]
MLSKYITMDPVPWLTDGENPAVCYLVKKEIIKGSDHEEIYNELISSNLTDYFRINYSNGILGDFKHLDLYYHGSVWFFLSAVESGYKCSSDFISSTADHLCSKTQLDSGGFKFNYKSSDAVGCRSGNMVYSLLKSGISDSRTDHGIQWIIKKQRKDGGWLHCPVAGFCDVMKLVFLNKPGNGLKHENDDNIPSCPVASYSCLKALVEFNSKLHNDSISNGADFFLKNNFFVASKRKLFCGNRVNFEKLGYPVMSQYDYLSGMVLLSEIKKHDYSKTGTLFNTIIKKQNHDGSWNSENKLQGMIKEKNLKSRWVTLNALRLINLVLEDENQLEKA